MQRPCDRSLIQNERLTISEPTKPKCISGVVPEVRRRGRRESDYKGEAWSMCVRIVIFISVEYMRDKFEERNSQHIKYDIDRLNRVSNLVTPEHTNALVQTMNAKMPLDHPREQFDQPRSNSGKT